MFIVWNAKSSSTPFGGAEVNERFSFQDALRSSERRRTVLAFGTIDITLTGSKPKRHQR
jgi:hypothetical protein